MQQCLKKQAHDGYKLTVNGKLPLMPSIIAVVTPPPLMVDNKPDFLSSDCDTDDDGPSACFTQHKDEEDFLSRELCRDIKRVCLSA